MGSLEIALRRVIFLTGIESTRKLLELIEIVDPFVQDPFGALEYRAPAVVGLVQPVALPVQVMPEGHRSLARGH